MPRSPSRDLSDRFAGNRGYFRRREGLRRVRIVLIAAAALAAAAWAVVDATRPTHSVPYAHSHGPLANVHAAFDNNCEACHRAHGIGELSPGSVFKARDRWHDLTCEKCHPGPAHHASANPAGQDFHARCSNCHHDHNGRLNSLVRLADKDCNQCHGDLNKYHDPAKSLTAARGEAPYAARVTSFVTDHPPFRSLDVDPKSRTLTFSHAVHMSPGQGYADKQPGMTVGLLRKLAGEPAVARYTAGQKDPADGAQVQLVCASCHALDAGVARAGEPGAAEFARLKGTLEQGDPQKSLLPPRAEGAYFLPVNFEAHCRSCHPLAANEGLAERDGAKSLLARFEVPHRVQPAELLKVLEAGYVKELLAGGHPLDPPKDQPAPLGKLDPAQGPGPKATFRDEAERLTGAARRLLLTPRPALQEGQNGCYKCHVSGPAAADGSPRIAAVPDRTVWFKHATFNHASHRGATCATCHPGTGAAYLPKADADRPEPVQIVGAGACRACHAPAGTKVQMPDGPDVIGGGARHNCTDCHRYHNGDNPLQGRGAAARATAAPLSLREWLTGSIKKD